MNRFNDWKKNLLNLDKRSSFINFKSKTVIPLLCKNLSLLEDEIARGNAFRIYSKDKYSPSTNTQDTVHPTDIEDNKIEKMLKDKNIILSDLNEIDTTKYLQKMHTDNRLYMQETGNNIIFLSLGFLNYFESKQSYKAPLVLIPLILNRKSIQSGYTLRANSDEAEFNLSLLEYLRKKHEISIPKELEKDLPMDTSGIDLDKIFNIFTKKIKGNPNWNVVEQESCISTFKFQKITMLKDLMDYDKQFKSHPLLKPLNNSAYSLKNPLKWKNSNLENVDHKNIHCPTDYDSSQLRAVLEAEAGNSFILQGPPGTGKSQTITNIISQLLFKGKKVLFIAQKKVALDVVKKKLEEIGIGDFLLDIHLDKSINISKKLEKNYQLIKDALEESKDNENWDQKIEECKKLKQKNNYYYHTLHNKHQNGMSAFEILNHAVVNKENHPKVNINLKSLDQLDKDQIAFMKEQIRIFDSSMKHIDYNIHHHPLRGITIKWTQEKQDGLAQKNNQILHQLSECISYYNNWYQSIFDTNSTQKQISFHDINIFEKLLNHLHIEKQKMEKYKFIFDNNLIFDKDFTDCLGKAINTIKAWNQNIIRHLLLSEHKNNLPHLELTQESVIRLKEKLDQASKNISIIEKTDTYWKKLQNAVKNLYFSLKKLSLQFRIYQCIRKLCSQKLSWKYIFSAQSIKDIATSFTQYIECKKEIQILSSSLPKEFSLWKKEDTIEKELTSFNSWRNDLKNILHSFESQQFFIECTHSLIKKHFQKIENNNFKQNTTKLIEMLDHIIHLLMESCTVGMDFYKKEFKYVHNDLETLKKRSQDRKNSMYQLRIWLNYCAENSKLKSNEHLKDILELMELSKINPKTLEKTFMYNYCREWKTLSISASVLVIIALIIIVTQQY